MLYLLWAIINIALFFTFIFLCYHAVKLLREKLGWWAAIIFTIGLLSLSKKDRGTTTTKSWSFISKDSVQQNSTDLLQIEIDRSWFRQYSLGVLYGKINKINTPINAYSTITGLSMGTYWEPISILVSSTDDNSKFKYEVIGEEKWKLLFFTVFSQAETYKGFIDLETKKKIPE